MSARRHRERSLSPTNRAPPPDRYRRDYASSAPPQHMQQPPMLPQMPPQQHPNDGYYYPKQHHNLPPQQQPYYMPPQQAPHHHHSNSPYSQERHHRSSHRRYSPPSSAPPPPSDYHHHYHSGPPPPSSNYHRDNRYGYPEQQQQRRHERNYDDDFHHHRDSRDSSSRYKRRRESPRSDEEERHTKRQRRESPQRAPTPTPPTPTKMMEQMSKEERIQFLFKKLGTVPGNLLKNIRDMCTALKEDMKTHASIIRDVITQTMEQVPSKIPIYSVLLACLMQQDESFALQVVQHMIGKFASHAKDGKALLVRRYVRIFSDWAHSGVISESCLSTFLDKYFVANLETEKRETSTYCLMVLLLNLPYYGTLSALQNVVTSVKKKANEFLSLLNGKIASSMTSWMESFVQPHLFQLFKEWESSKPSKPFTLIDNSFLLVAEWNNLVPSIIAPEIRTSTLMLNVFYSLSRKPMWTKRYENEQFTLPQMSRAEQFFIESEAHDMLYQVFTEKNLPEWQIGTTNISALPNYVSSAVSQVSNLQFVAMLNAWFNWLISPFTYSKMPLFLIMNELGLQLATSWVPLLLHSMDKVWEYMLDDSLSHADIDAYVDWFVFFLNNLQYKYMWHTYEQHIQALWNPSEKLSEKRTYYLVRVLAKITQLFHEQSDYWAATKSSAFPSTFSALLESISNGVANVSASVLANRQYAAVASMIQQPGTVPQHVKEHVTANFPTEEQPIVLLHSLLASTVSAPTLAEVDEQTLAVLTKTMNQKTLQQYIGKYGELLAEFNMLYDSTMESQYALVINPATAWNSSNLVAFITYLLLSHHIWNVHNFFTWIVGQLDMTPANDNVQSFMYPHHLIRIVYSILDQAHNDAVYAIENESVIQRAIEFYAKQHQDSATNTLLPLAESLAELKDRYKQLAETELPAQLSENEQRIDQSITTFRYLLQACESKQQLFPRFSEWFGLLQDKQARLATSHADEFIQAKILQSLHSVDASTRRDDDE